jgi:hypothetical protein
MLCGKHKNNSQVKMDFGVMRKKQEENPGWVGKRIRMTPSGAGG